LGLSSEIENLWEKNGLVRLQALGVPFCFRFPKSFKIKTLNGSTQTANRPQGKRIFEALSDGV
jgi:hypothetical protein